MDAKRRGPAIVRFAFFAFALIVAGLLPARVVAAPPPYTVTKFGDLNLDKNFDVQPMGVLGMNIERVYNSFDNVDKGIFGNGWNIVYEEYLTVQDDGSIVVHEWGGGASNAFTPRTSSLRLKTTVLDEIVHEAEASGKLGSDADVEDYRAWLERSGNDETEFERLRDIGLLKPVEPPIGSTFFSGRFGTEFVTRVPEGYQRETQQNGQTIFEAFSTAGRLTRIWNTDHDSIALAYDSHGRLRQMVDNSGNKLTFTFNADDLISRIQDAHGHVISYDYSDGYDLLSATVNGKTTHYEYDSSDLLTGIRYPDGTTRQFKYANELLSYVKDTDGAVTTYAYRNAPAQGAELHTVDVNSKDSSGKSHHYVNQYYYTPSIAQGYLSKRVDSTDGTATATTTYDRFGDVLTYAAANGTESFTYDDNLRQIGQQLPSGASLQWTYVGDTDAVATATTTDKDFSYTERFEYDPEGNLVHASDTGGLDFALAYDEYGRLAGVNSGALNLEFDYPDNRASNPDAIVLGGGGTVYLSYDPDGSVGGARSSAGASVVARVRAALEAVEILTHDAGVNVISLPAPSS